MGAALTLAPAPAGVGRLGVLLRAQRVTLGWSIDRLAARAGLARGTVMRLEHGRGVSTQTLYCVAQALGVQVEVCVQAPAEAAET